MIWLKKYKKKILISLFGLLSLNSYSFELQNIYFNQRMDGADGGYREFYIKNKYLTKQRYKINILPGSLKDASKFIEIYPKVITIEPQSKGTIKVFAKTPKDVKKQEYDFKLQFQPVNIPTLAKRKEGIISGTSNISIAPIIELNGYVGDINFNEALKFENIQVMKDSHKGIIVKGNLSNNSYASLDFGAEAYGTNEFLYGSSYIGNIPANTKNKEIELKFPMIKNPKDLKEIIFYRTPSNTREVVKRIKIDK
ncbi:MAG: hypothetical protein ACRC8M_01460 [Cetobacterium sp.]|uniref:hypothetical protein n=1 Tax=Cetobacterium sp. TaxID=2071632 RepID=UPI003F3B1A35